MAGPSGLTTEDFVNKVAWRLGRYVAAQVHEVYIYVYVHICIYMCISDVHICINVHVYKDI
jgi:hypothetical protein